MEPVQQYFLSSLRAALAGQPAQITQTLSQEEWGQLFHLAQQHKVLPLVFEAVRGLPQLQGSPLLPPLKQQVICQVMLQTRKTAEFLPLLQALRSAGVRPLVVKGLICRELYPMPDHRPSSDEDVLIPPDQAQLCRRILEEQGLRTQLPADRQETDYEIPYRQAEGPLYIELHKHLFPPESESYGDLNRFFPDAADRAVVHTVSGVAVYSLEYTDHLFYLICHAYKHFLHSGFGIRQVCDIVLYASAYAERINWPQLLDNCRQIRAHLFAAALLRIGQKYLGFDPEKARMGDAWLSLSVDEGPMLEDLLQSGIYGSASAERQHSSGITLNAVAARKQGRSARNGLLYSLFPSAQQLQDRYPYLKDRPWLLPAAWVSRMEKYWKESHGSQDNRASEALKIGNARVALLRQYGIIE